MRIFLFILFTLMIVPPVAAQNAPAAPVTAQDQVDALLGKKKPDTTPRTLQQYAQQHYQQCLKTQHPILSGKDLQRMCQCVRNTYNEAMTFENAQAIAQKTDAGQYEHYRMMMFVHAPCVGPTLKKMLQRECYGNNKNKYLMKNINATCGCVVERTLRDLVPAVPQYIQGEVIRKRLYSEPLSVVVNEAEFNRTLGFHTRACIRIHETLAR